MRLVPTRQALRLTGLSPATLREWTSRRALIPADAPAPKRGSPAGFAWQTVLVLRLAVVLRNSLRVELEAHGPSLRELRRLLDRTSFVALHGRVLAWMPPGAWLFLDENGPGALPPGDAVVLRLERHLEALARGFALPSPGAAEGQLDLFPAVPVATAVAGAGGRRGRAAASEETRRQRRRQAA